MWDIWWHSQGVKPVWFTLETTVDTTFLQPCYFRTASLKGQPVHPFDD